MTRKTSALLAVLLSVMLVPTVSSVAYGQAYMGNVGTDGETGQHTLEETLKIARDKIKVVQENPGTGSGTPYLALDGALGASLVTAGVFGGISAAFFVKARGGRYVAAGRG